MEEAHRPGIGLVGESALDPGCLRIVGDACFLPCNVTERFREA